MPDISSEEEVGVILYGYDENKPLYFYACLGLDLSNEEILFLSATGVPNEKFSGLNPEENPARFRERIAEINIQLGKNNKQFYAQSVEEELGDVFTKRFSYINEAIVNDGSEELKELLKKQIEEFRLSELTVALTPIDELRFDRSDQRQSEEKTSGNQHSDEDIVGSDTLMKITPVLDVQNGVSVDSLREGEAVTVKFTDDTIDQYNLGEQYEDSNLEATFLQFAADDNEAEGRMYVQLQEGVKGVAEVSRGSLIQQPAENDDSDEPSDYEDELTYLILSVVGLLILLAIYSFWIIF